MRGKLLPNSLSILLGFALIAVFLSVSARSQSNADRLKAQEHLSAGNEFLLKGEAEQASIQFGKVIEILPALAIGYINRGLAYASAAKYAEALSDAEKALSVADQGPDPKRYKAMAHQIKGHVYQAQGKSKLAIEAYSMSIDLEPSNAKFHNGRGISYMMQEDNQLALQDFDKAIELNPKLSQPYVNRAVVHRRLKNHTAAIQDLDTAIALNPSSASAFSNRATNYLDLKKYDEAIRDFSRAISLEPKSEYFYNRGRAYIDQGKYQSAIEDNTEAISRDPNNTKALHNRAFSYHRLGKNELAVVDLRRALALNQASSAARYNLAYILLRNGKYSEAASEATILINRFAQWRNPYILRAEAYARLGNPGKANIDRATASKLDAKWKPNEEGFFVFDLTIDIGPEKNQ